MRYQVRLRPKAEKHLSKLPKPYQDRIKLALVKIETDPYMGKRLLGEYKDQYSFRVWPYRLVYQVYKTILYVVVIDIEHRQNIYK